MRDERREGQRRQIIEDQSQQSTQLLLRLENPDALMIHLSRRVMRQQPAIVSSSSSIL